MIEFFAGELGVTCSAGAGQVGIYINGIAQDDTLVTVPLPGASPGAVQIVTNKFLDKGVHTVTTGETCATGTYGPHVPAKRAGWTVQLLAR